MTRCESCQCDVPWTWLVKDESRSVCMICAEYQAPVQSGYVEAHPAHVDYREDVCRAVRALMDDLRRARERRGKALREGRVGPLARG